MRAITTLAAGTGTPHRALDTHSSSEPACFFATLHTIEPHTAINPPPLLPPPPHRDVARCHVLAGEKREAHGRYLLIATSIPWRAVAAVLRKTLPGARVPTEVEAGPPPHPQALASCRKVFELGVHYTPIEVSLRDCALSLYSKGLLDGVIAPATDPRQTAAVLPEEAATASAAVAAGARA